MIPGQYKMKRELRDAWIADLTSDQFTQGEGALRVVSEDASGELVELCCLGVLACTAKRLGLPIELREDVEDALEWDGQPCDGGDYMPIQRHLFINGMEYGSSGFFAPFVRRNDGFGGSITRGEQPVPKESFPQIAEFIRDNVEAV